MFENEFSGQHAVVCGSTRGIGRATAELLASGGASVTLVARNAAALEGVMDTLSTEAGQTHGWIAVDFNDSGALSEALNINQQRLSGASILINNSGGPPGGLASDAGIDEFRVAFERHLVGGQLVTQAVIDGMKSRNYGRIINVISTSVKSPIPGLGVSNTIRGAVASWAKTLANELGPWGITVNNILPGATATDRLAEIISNKAEKEGKTVDQIEKAMMDEIPARRFATPGETAAAIAFLASREASYISGINLPVDGGRLSCL